MSQYLTENWNPIAQVQLKNIKTSFICFGFDGFSVCKTERDTVTCCAHWQDAISIAITSERKEWVVAMNFLILLDNARNHAVLSAAIIYNFTTY